MPPAAKVTRVREDPDRATGAAILVLGFVLETAMVRHAVGRRPPHPRA